jgi:hypothetical protein
VFSSSIAASHPLSTLSKLIFGRPSLTLMDNIGH